MEGAIRVLPSTYEESAVIGPCAEYAECRNATKIVDLWGQTPSVRIVVGRIGSCLMGTALWSTLARVQMVNEHLKRREKKWKVILRRLHVLTDKKDGTKRPPSYCINCSKTEVQDRCDPQMRFCVA